MGINRRKNSGSRKYYISEAYSSADFVFGEICKLGADSTNQFLKLDGEQYAGPLEIRKDDFIGVARQASAVGAGSVLTLTSDATNVSEGTEINFTIKNIILDDRAGGQLIKKTFKIIATASDAASNTALNDRVLSEMQNFFGSVAKHYAVAEATTTTVTITDNIGGSLAHSKVNGYLEGEVDLGFTTSQAHVTGSVGGGTKPEGVRGVINRYIDEADFSTGDVYTTVVIEYWDRDADGRARGDVMVRSQPVIYFNETDIAARTGTTVTHLNSIIDHLVSFAGLGAGDAIQLVAMAAANYAAVINANSIICEGATAVEITGCGNANACALPADSKNAIGYQLLATADATSTKGIFSEGETLAHGNANGTQLIAKIAPGVFKEMLDVA